jgi:hypothetical protein
MKKLFLVLVAGLFFLSIDAQVKKPDTAKPKNKGIVGQDSISRHNANKKKAQQPPVGQNKKREHKKNINEK